LSPLQSSPLGYRPLCEFLAAELTYGAGITCAEEIVASPSLQACSGLLHGFLLQPGDRIVIWLASWGALGAERGLAQDGVLDLLSAAIEKKTQSPALDHRCQIRARCRHQFRESW
jgi:hypothetical protein